MAKSRARQWADLLAGTPVALDDSNRLTVGDADTASATLDVATSSGNASVEIQAPSDSHSILKFGDTADDDVGHITYDHTADYMSFTANASERMRIDSSGNAGIGLTNPSTKLHVAGTVTATAFAGDGSSLTGIESLPAAIDVNGSAPDDSLAIDSAGKVGIGTSSPNYKLDVQGANLGGTSGDTVDVLQLYSNVGNSSYLNFQKVRTSTGSTWNSAGTRIQQVIDVTKQGYIQFNGDGNDHGVSFGTLNGERMRITSTGKVGIGTTSPTNPLTVIGSATIGNTTIAPITTELHVHKDFAGGTTPFGSESSVVISTNTTGAGTQGYIGSLWFGSQDVTQSTQYGWNLAGMAGYMAGDTSASGGSADLLFYTASSSQTGTERMRITSAGDVLPGANGTQDFGSTSLRWANIYTSDLHLNNGIGNYTIVEGEEDLFLYNNKNGKTYKFVLAEVDPSEAPKKMEK